MRSRLARLAALLTALLTTGLLVAAAPAAHAQDWLSGNDRGDALVTDSYGANESDGPKVVTSQERGDLTRVSVRHGENTLRIAVGLRGQSAVSSNLWIAVPTSGATFAITHGYYYGYRSDFLLRRDYKGGYGSFRCSGFSVTTTSTTVVARVPRACLGTPYRLRVGAQLDGGYGIRDSRGRVSRYVQDDVLLHGRFTARRPGLSPWIVSG